MSAHSACSGVSGNSTAPLKKERERERKVLSKAWRVKAEKCINGAFLSSSSATNVRRRKEQAGKVLPLKETFRTTFIPERRRGPWSRRRGQTRAAGKRPWVRVETAWMLITSTTGLQEPSMLSASAPTPLIYWCSSALSLL